jgi:ubiquitin carboxyl-terminal hydrolase L3
MAEQTPAAAAAVAAAAPPKEYAKHFTPLESSPQIFTSLLHALTGSEALQFVDVFSLEPDLLAFIPRPVMALVLIFPGSDVHDAYIKNRAKWDKAPSETTEAAGAKDADDGNGLYWFKQTIHNACGLYAILHAISNGPARDYISMYLSFLSVYTISN